MAKLLLALLIGVLIGNFIGYRYAHLFVAEECRRLGGFFVGRAVFKCVEVTELQPDDHQHP